MNKLKPCPFCGNKDVKSSSYTRFGKGNSFFVICPVPEGCGASSGEYGSRKTAIKYWNKRIGESND